MKERGGFFPEKMVPFLFNRELKSVYYAKVDTTDAVSVDVCMYNVFKTLNKAKSDATRQNFSRPKKNHLIFLCAVSVASQKKIRNDCN